MTNVPNGVETLPKISIAWVGCTNVTDDRRQTDDRQTDRHIANMNMSSRSLIISILCVRPARDWWKPPSVNLQRHMRGRRLNDDVVLRRLFTAPSSLFPRVWYGRVIALSLHPQTSVSPLIRQIPKWHHTNQCIPQQRCSYAYEKKQVGLALAPLSQRDRAAGRVNQFWSKVEDDILQTI